MERAVFVLSKWFCGDVGSSVIWAWPTPMTRIEDRLLLHRRSLLSSHNLIHNELYTFFFSISLCFYVAHKMCSHHHYMMWRNTRLCPSLPSQRNWLRRIHSGDLAKSRHGFMIITDNYSHNVLKPSYCHPPVGGCVAARHSYKWLINNMSAGPAWQMTAGYLGPGWRARGSVAAGRTFALIKLPVTLSF